jgi:hypothetical protein
MPPLYDAELAGVGSFPNHPTQVKAYQDFTIAKFEKISQTL